MAKVKYNLTGQRFGKLEVLREIFVEGERFWECQCDCGIIVNKRSNPLVSGISKDCGCTGKKIDLTGKRFGYLTAKVRITEDGKSKWQCICDCGNIKSIPTNSLCSGTTKSCGCKTSDLNSAGHTTKNGPINRWLYQYKGSAKNRNLEFDLSFDEFVSLVNSNCFYCGQEPTLHEFWKNQKRRSQFLIVNGIDRLNSDWGYTIDNCVSCCRICNLAKNEYSLGEFQNWISNLVRFKSGCKSQRYDQPILKSAICKLISRYKRDAKTRNIAFNLSRSEFISLITDNCHYCDLSPFLKVFNSSKLATTNEKFILYNGIDRKNNEIGYSIENSLTACVFCNRGKREMSYQSFIDWLEKIYSFNIENVYDIPSF